MTEEQRLYNENQELKALLKQCYDSMAWMIQTMQYKHDEETNTAFGFGDYSPELKEAMAVQDKIEEILF